MSILQAWYVVPGSIRGVAACGGLSGRLAFLRAGGNSLVGQGGGLLPCWVRGVSITKLTLHPHLQKLNTRDEVSQKGFYTLFLNNLIQKKKFGGLDLIKE